MKIEAGVISIDQRIEEGRKCQDLILKTMGKALIQAMEMERETGVNIKVIEPEYSYRPGNAVMTLERPSYTGINLVAE